MKSTSTTTFTLNYEEPKNLPLSITCHHCKNSVYWRSIAKKPYCEVCWDQKIATFPLTEFKK